MNSSRKFLLIFAGVLSLACAAIMIGFSALMYALETPLGLCLGIGSTSLFPLLIAVACLMPRRRTLAIRCIGAVVCVTFVGILIASFVAPNQGPSQRAPRRGALLTIALAAGAMALKGKWPGSENTDAPTARRADEAADQPA
jgi:hypothetical protein